MGGDSSVNVGAGKRADPIAAMKRLKQEQNERERLAQLEMDEQRAGNR